MQQMKKQFTILFNNKKPAYLVCAMAFFLCMLPTGLHAQTLVPLKANVDNAYVEPGKYAILDVLKNDEFGECNRNTLDLTITQYPTNGTAIKIPATNSIYYIPNAGFVGQDKLRYRISCSKNGAYSDTIVSINVFEKPENVMTDVCFVPRPATVWDIQKKAQSNVSVHPLATPFVGDLDGDGKLEVVVPNSTAAGQPGYNYGSDTIIVLDNLLKLKKKFKVPLMPTYPTMPLLIADVDNDGQGEIVIFTGYNSGGADMYRLKCYTWAGTLKWTSSVPVYTTSQIGASGQLYSDISLSLIIADIDGDGKSEILAGDKIFAAESGKLLATLPAGGRAYRNINSSTYVFPACMPAFADIDNDGKLEILAGNTTYRVNITNRSSTTNSVTKIASVAQSDGFVSVADINGDGRLDVIVTTHVYSGNTVTASMMYVWDGITGTMIGAPVTVKVGVSRAFTGDVDRDGTPEISFTCGLSMYAYKYNKATNSLVKIWENTTSDGSGCTTMSMFDFDQNGEAELVYRDETHLRILNKNGVDILPVISPSTLPGFPCYSATHTEYPIIVDFDRDGHADILVSGAPEPNSAAKPLTTNTRIMWFSSKTPNQWAPCRKVWNQHGFNPVYIDEELKPIQYPVNPATAFYEKGTGKINRPFNNFLQQTTTLNEEGTPLYLGPDLYFDNRVAQKIYIDDVADKLVITIGINNQGNASYTDNLRISTYVYDTNTSPATEYLIGSNNQTVDIAVGQQTIITYTISNYSTIMPPSYGYWEIRLNWQGNTYPINQAECKYYNNISSNLSISQGEHVMCEGNTERVYVFPQNTYWYKWYDDPVSDDPSHLVAEGDYYDILKDNSTVQPYYIEIWDLATKSKRISSVRDTIHIYLAPDSLIWTGFAKDMDWHNYENWLNPNDLAGLFSKANIPRKCTDVLIPDMISNYPDLTPATLSGHTIYDYYIASECANITFEHGGEVMRTDSLDYDAAYVHLTLNSNRWYMLSTPLQSLFPGDYYVKDPRPCDDDVFVYTRLYDKQNPETGKYVAGNWTGVFNNPNYALPAGYGFSAWVDDNQPNTNIHTPTHFLFPKHDANYIMYNRTESSPGVYNCSPRNTVPLNRVNEHRFVYEPVLNTPSGLITLNTSANIAGTQVIVGNPFMAHWDFKQFQSLNAAMIDPFYQLLDENGNFISYYITGGTTTGGLTQYIAPMQSVLVKSKIPFVELYTNARMTTTIPGDKLRLTASESNPELLSIKVSNGNLSNKSLLYYHPDFIPEEYVDVPKAFLNNITEPVTVYTLSQDGNLLDIQNADNLKEPIFLGVRTSTTGEFEFRFEGIHNFASNYDVYLTDLGGDTPTQINLRVFPYYTFKKSNKDLFTNDRFYLSFVQTPTDIYTPSVEATSGIEILSQFGRIKVLSVDGSPLKNVGVYDLQGRLINSLKNIQTSQIELSIQNAGIFIVRASNANISKSVKIYCK